MNPSVHSVLFLKTGCSSRKQKANEIFNHIDKVRKSCAKESKISQLRLNMNQAFRC